MADTPESDGTQGLLYHPLADLFPLLDGEEFAELIADIAKHGVREPITLHDGRILDGRNRARAAAAAGVACPTRIYDGNDPLGFVISLNIRRRHLTASDKRDLIAKLLKADPSKSDRRIAEVVKVSPTTVGTVRSELEAKGDVSKFYLNNFAPHLFHNCNLEWFLAAKGEQPAPMVLQEMLTPLLAERIELLVSQKHAKWA